MENKNYFWRPMSEYTGGRVLATNGLDVLIGEINSEGDCESEEGGNTILCGITGFVKIEEILPELKESEDERIRKWLVEELYKSVNSSINKGFDIDMGGKALAWLKKQGEQKTVECCADKLWTEFQKQVAYLMASSYNREYEYTKGYVEWVAQSLLGYAKNEIEQKPAWSEEDENIIVKIKTKIAQCNGFNKKNREEVFGLINSLRPQSQWKPSDEQMKALNYVVNLMASSERPTENDLYYNILKSLRQQLMKLKDEK